VHSQDREAGRRGEGVGARRAGRVARYVGVLLGIMGPIWAPGAQGTTAMCAAWLVRWAPAPSSNCPPDRSQAEIQNYASGAVTIVAVRGGPLAVTPRLGRAPSVCATPPAITTSRRFTRR